MSSEAVTYLRKELTKLRDDLSRAIDRGMDPRTHATAMDVVRAMYARLDVALLIEREQRAREARESRSQPTVAIDPATAPALYARDASSGTTANVSSGDVPGINSITLEA